MANESGQGLEYSVDLVMCIDGTKSMYPIIEEVKANALSFYQRFVDGMEANEPPKNVGQLRVKVIVFRDYGVDAEPMAVSPFFCLGDGGEDELFNEFVNGITATGGGDAPEDSLEALALAMRSDWVRTGAKKHVIMMFTDTGAHMFTNADKPGYDPSMPKNLAELRELWEGQEMDDHAKRLLLLTPDCEPWTGMFDWTNTFHLASKAGCGCSETDIDACIHMLVQSI